jgi:hypothetical protein
VFVVAGKLVAFVGKDFVQLGSENKVGIVRDAFEPGAGSFRFWRVVETAVDFYGIKVPGDQCQRVEFCPATFRIDATAPVSIRPPGRANQNVTMSGHEVSTMRVSGWDRILLLIE